MKVMSRKEVEVLRKRYPKGTRVELVSLEDPYARIPEGTKGTVDAVDDIGRSMRSADCLKSRSFR